MANAVLQLAKQQRPECRRQRSPARAEPEGQVWQIDPFKCVQCEQCRTHCVLDQSAVRCVHDFSMCGYCEFCFGFFRHDALALTEAAENLDHWCRYVLARQFSDPTGWELQNMLCAARLMVHSALAREETRGCHVRTDFPERDDTHWNRHAVFNREQDEQLAAQQD